jgi:hypothetical protein
MDTSFDTWIITALETSTLSDVKFFLEDAGYSIQTSPMLFESMPPMIQVRLDKDGHYALAFGLTEQEALITAYKTMTLLDEI